MILISNIYKFRIDCYTVPHMKFPAYFFVFLFLTCARADFTFDGFTLEAHSTKPHQLWLLDSNEQAFSQRLKLIENAKKSILIDIFYLMHDESGKQILAALINKKLHMPEVEIRIHLDSWGSATFTDSYMALLQNYGIQIRRYLGPRFYYVGPNRKNHRKTWIIDNRIALLGGYNMGDEHFGFSPVFNMVDREVLIEGPIVAAISKAFELVWNQTPEQRFTGVETAKINLQVNKSIKIQTLTAITVRDLHYVTNIQRLNEPSQHLRNRVAEFLASAKSRIIIETKFFYPSFSTYFLLAKQLVAKIPIRIFSNTTAAGEPYDRNILLVGSQFLSGLKFLGADVKFFTGDLPTGPAQVMHPAGATPNWGTHARTLVIDNTVILGSYNLDLISDYLNLEQILVVRSPEFATATLNSILLRTGKTE